MEQRERLGKHVMARLVAPASAAVDATPEGTLRSALMRLGRPQPAAVSAANAAKARGYTDVQNMGSFFVAGSDIRTTLL